MKDDFSAFHDDDDYDESEKPDDVYTQKDVEDSQQVCVPYHETLEDEAIRMAGYFQDWRPWQAIDPVAQLPISEALKLYGLGNQARDGDITDPAPSIINVTDRLKWNAWHAEHGKSRLRAGHAQDCGPRPFRFKSTRRK